MISKLFQNLVVEHKLKKKKKEDDGKILLSSPERDSPKETPLLNMGKGVFSPNTGAYLNFAGASSRKNIACCSKTR